MGRVLAWPMQPLAGNLVAGRFHGAGRGDVINCSICAKFYCVLQLKRFIRTLNSASQRIPTHVLLVENPQCLIIV